jgi:hypothetical protein
MRINLIADDGKGIADGGNGAEMTEYSHSAQFTQVVIIMNTHGCYGSKSSLKI